MDNKDFWNERVQEYGHTGWANPAFYAFDQEVRVKIVKRLVLENSNINNILDFGGGTGDFIIALEQLYKKAVLYDPCESVVELARKRLPLTVNCYSDLESLKDKEVHMYDIILSITVLQHIMTDEEMGEILTFLQKKLSKNGKFIVMETFEKNTKSEYKRNWSYDEFVSMISKHGFEVEQIYDYYNPSNKKNEKFNKYISRIDTKALLWINSKTKINVSKALKAIASRYNENVEDFYGEFTTTPGSKFIVLKQKILCD